jgi:photosystem II stability/assembly factor-like uncharacterized protein
VLLLKATTESLQVTNSVPAVVPTLKGSSYVDNASGTNITVSPDTTISTGDWMIMVFESYNTVTWTDPTGWTVILPQGTVAGTLVTSIYAKNRVAGETSYTITMPAHSNASLLTLMWGSGAAPIANWVIGTNMLRANITPTTSYNNLAPSITTTTANNLVLAISTERYTGTTEARLASMTGATQWLFVGEPNATEVETLSVGYIQQAAAGATSNVTTTYYAPQATNGMAIQIGLPPGNGTLDYSVSYTDDGLPSGGTMAFDWNATSLSLSNGSEVLSWTDSITSSSLTGTTGTVPTYLASAVNGMPAVLWPTIDNNKILSNTSIASTNVPFTTMLVVNVADNTPFREILIWGQEYFIDYGASLPEWNFYAAGDVHAGATATTGWHIITFTTDGTTATIYIDGTQVASGSSTRGNTDSVIYVGGHPTITGRNWRGDIARITLFNSLLTTSQRATEHTVRSNAYAITVSDYANKALNISSSEGVVTSATITTIAPTPAALTTRLIKLITITNTDPYINNKVTFQKNINGVLYQIGSAVTLLPGEMVTYMDRKGWKYYSTTGVLKNNQTLINSSSTNLQYNSSNLLNTTINPTGTTAWTVTNAPSLVWSAIASSADGTKLAAVINSGLIYTSTNSGLLWTAQAGSSSLAWSAIASSADGVKLVAAVNGGYIYTSTNSGITWTQQTSSGSRAWAAVISSTDGTHLTAAVSSGFIYTAPDSGVTWTQAGAVTNTWRSLAASSDGIKLAAVTNSGNIYTSKNFGLTWTQQTGAPSQTWTKIASSADGTHLVAANNSNGFIYTSSNTGVTWVQTNAPSQAWSGLVSSTDGTKLAAANTGNGFIYTSSNTGVTWVQTNAPSQVWTGLASSADGTKLAAANSSNGFIYTAIVTQASNPTWTTTGASLPVATQSSNPLWIMQLSSTSQTWYWITSSADGNLLAAVVYGGYIYTSSSTGASWTQQTGSGARNWWSIASSADGTKLAAVVNGGYIYTSTNSGVTWTQQTSSTSQSWNSIASSSDGTHLVAAVSGGYIYTSTNLGVTWTQQTSSTSQNWIGVASSADGTKLVAVVQPGYIYTSTNSGVTWTQQTGSGSLSWNNVASSADGTKLVANISSGYIYTSTNSGVTWTQQTGSTSQSWSGIASSADGSVLAANTFPGNIYISTNSGVTWTQQTSSPSHSWAGIIMSADGTKMAAVVNGGFIYTFVNNGITGIASNNTIVPLLQSNSSVSNSWVQQTNSGTRQWNGIGGSSDGIKLAAASNVGYIYTSPDSGSTWTQQTSSTSQAWNCLASSADGTHLAAVVASGYIYTSTNSGVTWTQQTSSTSQAWSSIASSADGTILAAVVGGGYIYTSTNSGVTWTQQTSSGSQNWVSIAMSADGTIMVAAYSSSGVQGYIYTSTNSGVTWTAQPDSGSQYWNMVTMSADGTKILAGVYEGGYIYSSLDSGVTWTQTGAPLKYWQGIAMSADGTKIVALEDGNATGGYPWISTNSGVSWTPQLTSPLENWLYATMSADGTKIAACGYNSTGYIYTYSLPINETNTLALPFNNSTLALSAWKSTDPTSATVTITPGTSVVITLDATAASAPNVLTWTHVVGSNATILVVAITFGGTATSTPVLTCAWNGTAMTSLGQQESNDTNEGFVQLFYLMNPMPGSYSIVATSNLTSGITLLGLSTSFIGVGSIGSPVTGYNGTVTSFTATIPSAAGHVVLIGAATGSAFGAVTAPGVRAVYENNNASTGAGNAGIAYQASTGTSTTITWAITNDDDGWIGIDLIPLVEPTVTSVGATASTVTSTLAVPVPYGVTTGSLVVITCGAEWLTATLPTTAAVSASGFTVAQIATFSPYSGYSEASFILYKYATGADSGTYTLTFSAVAGANIDEAAGVAAIIVGGPPSGNPFTDTFRTGTTALGSSVNVSSFTPSGNNSLLLASVWNDDSFTTSYASGWTNNASSSANPAISLTTFQQSTAAATGTLTWGSSASTDLAVLIGTIRPTITSIVSTPSTYTLPVNTTALYARTTASNSALSIIDPALLPTSLQNALWQDNFMMWTPGPSNVGTWVGTSGTNVNSGTGVTASVLPTTTNVYTGMRRTTIATAVTTVGQSVGLRSDLMFFQGTATGQGGFFFSCRFGFDVITAGCRAFVGFTTSTTPVAADPSALTNIIGFGFDAADTAWSFYHNGSVGTATKEPISGQGVLATNNTGYDAYIWCAPYSSTVYYRLDRTDTGATIVNSSVSYNLPLITSLTTMMAEVMMSNGANTGVGAATLGINRLYVETIR